MESPMLCYQSGLYLGISLKFCLHGTSGHLLVTLIVLKFVPLVMRINGVEHCSGMIQKVWEHLLYFGKDTRLEPVNK